MKRIFSLILVLVLTISCALADGATALKWVDASVEGAIDESTVADPKDNFYLYANKEWLLDNQLEAHESGRNDMAMHMLNTAEQLVDLMQDYTLDTHAAKLAQTFFDMLTDRDMRNAMGMIPIIDRIKRIEALDSIDALNAYLASEDALLNNICV